MILAMRRQKGTYDIVCFSKVPLSLWPREQVLRSQMN